MDKDQDFQMREIKQEQVPVYAESPKKKTGGLIFLFSKKNLPKTLLVIIILVILIATGAILWGRHSFSKARVQVDLEIPDDIASGKEVVLLVKYKNKNRVSLNDAFLFIDYPSETFSLEGGEIHREKKELGTVFRKSEGEEEFKVRFVGEKGDVKNLIIRLDYQPQNISSRFENSSSFKIEINSVSIDIDIQGSEKTISGQEVNYIIKYGNETDEDFSDLKVELTYADDFEFEDAQPQPIEETNNIWQVDILEKGQRKEIRLKGILRGEENENKILKVAISKAKDDISLPYSQSEFITQISSSPLLLLLKIEGIEDGCKINPGQRLNYRIEFKNNTDVALSELILKAYFKDSIFDFKTLNLGDVGFFDSRENVITWSGGEVLALNLLKPNQSDKVSFSVEIKDSLPIFDYNDKNFRVRVLAEIATLTIPASFSVSELKVEKELICKINSQLDLDTKVYYYESGVNIRNKGPIPPRVDQLTTYTVHWQLANVSNDLENLKIWAILPQGIEWQNNYINKVSNSRVSYNSRTQEVIWQIDKVPAGVGVILPLYELVFQIGLRPSINQINQTPTLINESSAEGKDSFTEKILKDFTPIVDTSLPDDLGVSSSQGRVQK